MRSSIGAHPLSLAVLACAASIPMAAQDPVRTPFADQAYQRHLMEDEPVSPTDVEKFGAMIADCMQRAAQQIRIVGGGSTKTES